MADHPEQVGFLSGRNSSKRGKHQEKPWLLLMLGGSGAGKGTFLKAPWNRARCHSQHTIIQVKNSTCINSFDFIFILIICVENGKQNKKNTV